MALSFETTGRYTSERFEAAAMSGKLTSGEAAQKLRKKGIKITAKELVEAYTLLYGREPEWHHAGFYKGGNGSTMGRTFFFTDEQVEEIKSRFSEIEILKSKKEVEIMIKKETIVEGFYFVWDYDYSGKYGKKRNFKVLKSYSGSELSKPNNFTPCNDLEFESVKKSEGKKYFGWDEPSLSEFK